MRRIDVSSLQDMHWPADCTIIVKSIHFQCCHVARPLKTKLTFCWTIVSIFIQFRQKTTINQNIMHEKNQNKMHFKNGDTQNIQCSQKHSFALGNAQLICHNYME